MQWQQIHHVAIIVSDYPAAREFYVEKLGFPIVRENFRPARGDWKLDLRVGNGPDAIELEIFGEVNPPPAGQPARSLWAAASGVPGAGHRRRRGGTGGQGHPL